MGREGAQPGAFVVLYDLVGVGDRNGAVGFLLPGLVGAAAVVAVASDAKVVVAGDGGDASLTDGVDDLVGPGIVADEVAQAIKGIGFLLIDAGKKGFESREVGMYVAE